jgi:RNase P subunit RPR2
MSETFLSIACKGCNRPIVRGFTGTIPATVPLECIVCKANHEYQTDRMNQEGVASVG